LRLPTEQDLVNVDFVQLAHREGDGLGERLGRNVFPLSGPDFYPSAAYARIDAKHGGAGEVRIAAAGDAPDDGFTGYPALVGGDGGGRWGDYSAAVADEKGNIWFATEYVLFDTTTLPINSDLFLRRLKARLLRPPQSRRLEIGRVAQGQQENACAI